eukprot:gb/GECH01004766.1/.p1 GENE.gb/GECH01004766.1/~~gb/GECH01004766.1/.p1  ORF type:complete len:184 (+),score=20.47 gb/GECH01004766.1/:1-552(+)
MKLTPNSETLSKKEDSSQRERDKYEDVDKLTDIFELIQQWEEKTLSLKNTLIKIGDLAGGERRIFFNDKKDKEIYYIRNKYGYIQRNKENTINPDGIYFEKLYYLKIILGGVPELQTDSGNVTLPPYDFEEYFESQKEGLGQDLLSLKQKILYILGQEKKFVQRNDIVRLLPETSEFRVKISP